MLVKVEIEETLRRVVEIEADSEEEALMIANEQYQEELIVLDSNDYVDTDIKLSLEE